MDKHTYIPDAFLDDVASYLPEHLQLQDFVAACQRPLKRAVRVNTLKMSVAAFRDYCADKQWHITAIPWCPEDFAHSPARGRTGIAHWPHRHSLKWLYLCARGQLHVAADGPSRCP